MSTERESETVFQVRFDIGDEWEFWKESLRESFKTLFWSKGAVADSLVPFKVERFFRNLNENSAVMCKIVTTPFSAGTSVKIVGSFLHLYNADLGAYTVLDMASGFVLEAGGQRVSFGNGGAG